MEEAALDMNEALRKMLQEMYPRVPISRSGVALLAAEIDALEKKRATMRCLIILDEPGKELK